MRYLSLMLILLPLVTSAAIYQSVDKNGNTTFSDQPSENSKTVELGSATTYDAPPLPVEQSTATSIQPTEIDNNVQYTALVLASPLNNSTFWQGGSAIAVQAKITPALQSGDEAVLLYDGQALSSVIETSDNLSFTIDTYNVGKHTIAVEVRRKNKAIKTSNSINFYVLAHRKLLKQS